MSRVVIINGYPGAGKDTFVELCSKFATVDNVLTSTPAKNALTLLGWNGEKTPEARDLLAILMEASYEMFDGPINYVREKLDESEADLFFIHVREPYNIKKFVEILGNPLVIFIDRDINKDNLSNDSDRNVEEYPYDLIIYNNGTLEELEGYAQSFTKLVKKGWF